GMEYVDIFFCHRPDPEVQVDETIRAIEDLINQGKVLYWGTSMWTASDIDGAYDALVTLNMNRPVVEQPVYNMLDRDFVEGSLEESVGRHGMGFVVFSPLAEGTLTGKYNDGIPGDSRVNLPGYEWLKEILLGESGQARLEAVRQLGKVADDLGTSMSRMALAWCLKNPHVSTVITGASKVEQVTENMEAIKIVPQLTDDVMKKIDEITAGLAE
ncbi:MAG: aldo/keto reductase, partial [Chloroflexota bacterium]